MLNKDKLLKEALILPVKEKTELIEQLISSLDQPDPELDALWTKETEIRIDAYDQGRLTSVSLQEAVSKYKK